MFDNSSFFKNFFIFFKKLFIQYKFIMNIYKFYVVYNCQTAVFNLFFLLNYIFSVKTVYKCKRRGYYIIMSKEKTGAFVYVRG